MSHRACSFAIVLVVLGLATACAESTIDRRAATSVSSSGVVAGPPRTLSEGPAPVPIPGHPPVTASGVVASFDPSTAVLRFEDGRLVRLTSRSRALPPTASPIRMGDFVVLHDVLPVGVQSGFKTLNVGRAQRMGTVASVDEAVGVVRLTDGALVRVSRATNLHMGAAGSSVALTSLNPGDEIVVVQLEGEAPPAGDEVSASPSALARQRPAPTLEAAELMIFRVPGRP